MRAATPVLPAPARRCTSRAARRNRRIRGRDPNRRSWLRASTDSLPVEGGSAILARAARPGPWFVHSGDRGAAATRLRSHPSNLIRVMPAKGGRCSEQRTELGHHAGSGAPAHARRPRERDAVEQPRPQPARPRRRRACSSPRSRCPRRCSRSSSAGSSATRCSAARRRSARRRACRRWSCCARPLGRAGSYLPTGLNVLQNLGWTIFEVLVIATAAQALVHGPLWVWKLAAAAAATILALLGPIGFVRVWVKRVALWVVLASLALPDVVDAARRRPRRALVAARAGRPQLLAGSRPRGRAAGLVAAARRRLHALLAEPPRRVLGIRRRLLHPERVALRARRDPAALARPRRRAVGDHRDRHRRRRGRVRARRARRSTRRRSRSRTSTPRPSRSRTSCRACRSGCSSSSSRPSRPRARS